MKRKPNRPVWLWRAPGPEDIRGLSDEWALNGERYEGAWIYQDFCAAENEDDAAYALAVLLVARVVANTVRRAMRGEDLSDDIEGTLPYIDELELTDAQARNAYRLLDALHPFAPARVADELLASARLLLGLQFLLAARFMCELAYDVARAYDVEDSAIAAALGIARLATLDECPRSARLWNGRAAVHRRRVVRQRATRHAE